jgi:transcriptional regulator with XRE-family HTH domain
MTGTQLRAALAELNFTQAAFAKYIGAHEITITNWCRGARPIPLRIQRLVEAMLTVESIAGRKNPETIAAPSD